MKKYVSNTADQKGPTFTISRVDAFLKHLFYKARTFFLPDGKEADNANVNEPELNLFLWAVVSNRVEIAKIFWRLGKVETRKLGFLFFKY